VVEEAVREAGSLEAVAVVGLRPEVEEADLPREEEVPQEAVVAVVTKVEKDRILLLKFALLVCLILILSQ
jgi:hypothetical protein